MFTPFTTEASHLKELRNFQKQSMISQRLYDLTLRMGMRILIEDAVMIL